VANSGCARAPWLPESSPASGFAPRIAAAWLAKFHYLLSAHDPEIVITMLKLRAAALGSVFASSSSSRLCTVASFLSTLP
jgi:hypothetical protein